MTRYPKKGRGHKWTVRELESIPTAWAKDSIADGGGLTGQVRVVNGTAAVAFRYSFKWDGRKVWYYCGNWPTVDLVTIRERRDNARALVAKGVDPRRQKVADKIEAQLKVEQVISEESQRRAHDLSVKDLYDAWISEGVRRSDENAELKRIFGKDVLPTIGDSALRALSEDDIKKVLRPVIARGANRLAVIIFGAIGQMLGWQKIANLGGASSSKATQLSSSTSIFCLTMTTTRRMYAPAYCMTPRSLSWQIASDLAKMSTNKRPINE